MITVFGSINLDLIGRVERLPQPGETVPGDDFSTAPGGKGANQALAAVRAGAAVQMVGAVGGDAFADEALALLRTDGVDLERVRVAGGATGVALILVDQAGENVIAVIPGANGTLTPDDAAGLTFAAADVLLLQLEVPVAAIEMAAKRARDGGAAVLLNLAPFRTDALHLVQHATHLIVNETECAAAADALGVAEGTLEDRAKALAAGQAVSVIVTLGKDGVMAIADGVVERVAAPQVDAIDTVGAGDTFCGYFAAGLLGGLPQADALKLAATAGSLACTKAGAQPSIPFRREVASALGT